jgi:hypothetical protein
MVKYTVKVFTGKMLLAGTLNSVYVKLVGRKGESKRVYIPKTGSQGSVSSQKSCIIPQSIWVLRMPNTISILGFEHI